MNNLFIKKAKQIHGKKYDYSLVNYINNRIKIKIICPVHGEFEQIPRDHLSKKGCIKCGLNFKSKDDFVNKAIEIHKDKYDYSKVDYKTSKIKVKLICKKHGEFEQRPNDHLKGYGCPKCGFNLLSKNDFANKSSEIHNDKYDYSKVDYQNNKIKTKIICPVHGEFEQTPVNHLRGNGCPKCGAEIVISKAHQEIIDLIEEDKIINDRETIKPNELDIYIPSKNIAIEFNGLYWHSYDELESKKEKFKHHNKSSICYDKGIQLIQIFEDEWLFKKEIVKSILNAKLGINNKIFARKCFIKELTSNEFNEFCNNNHIQGKLNSVIKLGLIHENRLVCVIGFNKHCEYDYECTRFCNELNINIVGGASRLFKYFLNKWKPNSVLSFADRRYSNGGLYKQLGFKLINVTSPGYFYTKGLNRLSRQKFQKHKLEKKLENFNWGLSESQNMFNNGYRRLWDAGHWKFVWNVDNI
jgi:predicted RNA-binding Zn-ribbon protein involved in translation (DUF1610 family)